MMKIIANQRPSVLTDFKNSNKEHSFIKFITGLRPSAYPTG